MTIREREQAAPRPTPRPAADGSEASPTPRSAGPFGRVRDLLLGVRSEIRKITWPSRMETRNLTIVVIGISVFIGGVLGVFDLVLVAIIKAITNGAGGL